MAHYIAHYIEPIMPAAATVTHHDLQQKQTYVLHTAYAEYVGRGPISAGTFLGQYLRKSYGPITGGDRNVYYVFEKTITGREASETKTTYFVLDEFYIEKNNTLFRQSI